ncbi:TonB-dependent receptor [Putridiphycobacter roseus]|uniref:TonB-dependent receptor n=1 Tax=Putridiphycobacter roseus TaxID=2219161 RepID=A0A2W1MYE5_9FLAO|nr:TonB-dependent receptor [Putridiphycobacter roseus]PZE16404.1 TonB-dependent receptor [Putridiphycobacter roseus]
MVKIFIFLSITLCSLQIFGQTGTVRGFIKSNEDGNAIPFVRVYIKELELGVNTDFNGFYSIPKIKVGTYTLTATNVEFVEFEKTIVIEKDKILNLNIDLDLGKFLKTVEVSGAQKEKKTSVQTSVIKITQKDILRVPTTGGEADIATYFQTVPGVVSTGDQGGQVYVRGGTPIQNKILLDGMTIYNPFHSIGFFSVFETDLIRSADIYTGGFNAKYGGRISSIMDVKYRDGNSKRLSGLVGLSPFTTKVLLEGPLSKKDNVSFILSSKMSLLEQTSKAIYPYVNDGDGLPFNFMDLYGKVSFAGSSGNQFNVFGFSFNDQVKYQAVSDLNWNSYGVGTNFAFVPQSSQIYLKGRINYSQYDITLDELELPERYSAIKGFEMAFDFTYFLKEKSQIDFGFQFNYFLTDYKTSNSENKTIQLTNNEPEAGLYLSYKKVSGRFVFEPSIRLQIYPEGNVISPEPRIGAKYNLTEDWRIKMAGGYFTQNYVSTTSDRDVVNLFYGFLNSPSNYPKEFTKSNGETVDIENGLQKAYHLIFGTEYDLTKKMSLNIEGYYKWFTQLTNLNPNKLFEDTFENANESDLFKKEFIIENGQAMGVDFVFKYSTKKFYFWTAYSLGKVTRWNGFDTYYPVFDRRHNVNVISTYNFGKDGSWEASVRWNLGSGLPFKKTTGVGDVPTISTVGDNYVTANNSDLTLLYENLNTGRLPAYHRLDINIKKTIESKKHERMRWEIIAGVTNAYSQENIFYINRVTAETVYQLPIMPSIALSWRF